MGRPAIRLRGRLQRHPWLVAVFVAGLVARAALIPLTHGDDFIVWDKASTATLRGVNVYAHHPDYPHGPFAYFPLFLYVELPFKWLAQQTGASFVVLGKLPVLVADLACAALIAAELRRRGTSPRVVAAGTALFFLNPLVLYNSAYYGRFDTVGCALLLVALGSLSRDATVSVHSAVYYALAVVAKTFPVFLLAGMLRRAGDHWRRVVVVLAVVAVVVSAPYLAAPWPFAHDIVFYDAGKPPQGLSWQHLLLHVMSTGVAKAVSYALLAAFVVGSVRLTRIRDLWLYTVCGLLLFILCSKVVLEQYLIWPMPFLLAVAAGADRRLSRASVATVLAFTVFGMLDNESLHPFGRSSDLIGVLLAAVCTGYLVSVRRASRAPANRSSRSPAPAPRRARPTARPPASSRPR